MSARLRYHGNTSPELTSLRYLSQASFNCLFVECGVLHARQPIITCNA